MLELPDHWMWDFWMADDGIHHHLYFLKAPRSIGDSDSRHWHVSIGHARSINLVDWELLPDALAPGPDGDDDYTTWTGSIVRDPAGPWRMFYTGTARRDDGMVQRIFRASSTDLMTWTRDHLDALEADTRWYERLGDGDWQDEAWRDPWVEPDPSGSGWRMLITARVNHGPDPERGVIGHAWSPDLRHWEVRPPLSAPGAGFGHIEVPQLAEIDGRWLLAFSCPGNYLSAAGRERHGTDVGTWAVWIDNPADPLPVKDARPITDATSYAGRVVAGRDGNWHLLTFRGPPEGSLFHGVINDPIPLTELDIPTATPRPSPVSAPPSPRQ